MNVILCHVTCVLTLLVITVADPPINLDALQRLQQETDKRHRKSVAVLFADFKRIFNKTYEDVQEATERQQIFADRILYVRSHNNLYRKGKKTYSVGINKFSDITHREFRQMYTTERRFRTQTVFSRRKEMADPSTKDTSGIYVRKKRDSNNDLVAKDVPSTLDLRQAGYLTSVKDQGDCGSCWAFSIVGAVEAQMFKKTGNLVSLSSQQLVDCDSKNYGCEGGNLIRAMLYIKDAGGVQAEQDYPYEAKDASCRFNRSEAVPGTHVIRHVFVPPNRNDHLQAVLFNNGPVTASMDINPRGYMSYLSGVFYEEDCSTSIYELDHAVLIVGYGTDPEDYWLIKNSMGTSWGESGYMKLAMNRTTNCGITIRPMYPEVVSAAGIQTVQAAILYCGLFISIVYLKLFYQ